MTTKTMQPAWQQLALPIYLQEENTFENFYPASNGALLHCIKAVAARQVSASRYLYLWGHSGAGCSHLLQAACQYSIQQGISAVYIPLAKYDPTQISAYLSTLNAYELVCLDDLESISGNIMGEEHLFHSYNQLTAQGSSLIIAAHGVPKQLSLSLADLVSRLESGLLFQVHDLNDQEKLAALQLRAQLRGFTLPPEVGKFLMARLARHPSVLLTALNQLDDQSLANHRRLTIPFVKQILAL